MSANIDSSQLSDIIQTATETIAVLTKESIDTFASNTLGSDTVSVMSNGVQTTLNRADYEVMKEQNNMIHQQMKQDLKIAITNFKNDLKAESNIN